MIENDLNSFIVILIYGSLLLLSFLKITNPLKVNRRANFWFGILLFLWSTFWIDEVAAFININSLNLYFVVILHFVQFLIPIIFYLSVSYFTNPDLKVKKTDTKYLVLPFVYLIILFIQQIYVSISSDVIQIVLTGLILVQALFYTIASYLKIKKHQKNILLFSSNTSEIDLNWLKYIIASMILISVIISIYNIFFNLSSLNIYINFVFLAFIYLISYYLFKQKEIFPLDETQRSSLIFLNEEGQEASVKRKIISDKDLIKLKSKLKELMQQEKPFLDSELNLIKLATLLNITSHQLSYVINTGFNENFFRFINKYRVQEAKKLMVDEKMQHLSILGIAFESGFNSKTSFNTTFKKITTQTPSEFKKNSSNL